MRILLVLSFFTVFAVSCDDRKDVKTLRDQTMAIHDEAMKEMADMNRKGRNLKQELATLDTLPANQLRRAAMVATLAQMEKAEAGMMAWMEQYQAPDDLPNAAAIKYLEEQKRLMEENLAAMKVWKGEQ